jgi:hypothetical protein
MSGPRSFDGRRSGRYAPISALYALHRAGADAEPGGDLVHALVAFQQTNRTRGMAARGSTGCAYTSRCDLTASPCTAGSW